MTRDLLIAAIQTRIDDVVTDGAIEVVSNPVITEILDQQLSNAFKYLPLRFLPYKAFSSTIINVQEGLYSVELPTDFLRLVRFKTSILKRPLMGSDLVTEGSRDHIFMFQSYVRGGNSRTRGCLIKDTVTKLLFNASDDGTIEEANYVAVPTHLDVSDAILDPVAWYVASVALQILGEAEASKSALVKVTEFINQN